MKREGPLGAKGEAESLTKSKKPSSRGKKFSKRNKLD